MKYVNSTGCKGNYAFLNCNTGKAFLTALGKRRIVPTRIQGPPPVTVCLSREVFPFRQDLSGFEQLERIIV